jgi:hypothetical protein
MMYFRLGQCFPTCGMRTTSGMLKDFKGYAAEKLLEIVPEFYLLSDKL